MEPSFKFPFCLEQFFARCVHYWAEYLCWFTYNGKCSSLQGHHQCFYILIGSVLLLAQISVTSCPKMYALLGTLKRCFITAREWSTLNLSLIETKRWVWSEFLPLFCLPAALSVCECVWVIMYTHISCSGTVLSVYKITVENTAVHGDWSSEMRNWGTEKLGTTFSPFWDLYSGWETEVRYLNEILRDLLQSSFLRIS